MSVIKCSRTGCHNRVAQVGDVCDECRNDDLGVSYR
jgi:hypothetical protein